MDANERQRLEVEVAEMRALETLSRTGPAGAALANVYARVAELQEMLRPQISVEPTVVPPAEVRVELPELRVTTPDVTVNVPDQSAAIAALTAGLAQVVDLLRLLVEHETAGRAPERKQVSFTRNGSGVIVGATVEG